MANPAYDTQLDRYMGAGNANWPARYASAVTPSDTEVSVAIGPGGNYAKRLYVGGAGNVTLITAGDTSNELQGTPVTYEGVPAGTYLHVQVRAVLATGTTATQIVGEAD
jgi:hypothetical protein